MTSTTRFSTTKTPGSLELAVFGDVHLGNARTTAIETIAGLDYLFSNTAANRALDMIIIEGDLFDESLPFHSEYLPEIQSWMIRLLRFAHQNNIALRVLEGTPSHDMKQSRQFQTLIEATGLELDFLYVDDMRIEFHSSGASILYVPDEWSTDLDYCYRAARKLITDNGLEQVDFIVMHGAFDYQLPPNLGIKTHDSKLWQKLVRFAVFVGHIHQYSQYGKIKAAGSVDRHTFGDEKAKGYIRATISDAGDQYKFIPNPLAKKYLRIDVRGKEPLEALEFIREFIVDKKVPKGSFLQIHCKESDNSSKSLNFFQTEYEDFHWDVKVESDKVKCEEANGLLPTKVYRSVSLTKDNLVEMMGVWLKDHGTDGKELELALSTLEQVCKAVN